MWRIARGGRTSGSGPETAGARSGLPGGTSVASGAPWTELVPATPPGARCYQGAIYDPVRDRMVVFGGIDDSDNPRNDVWALSLAGTPEWTALEPTGTPPRARAFHTAIYDPVRDRMVVFGGDDDSIGACNDVWALSLAGTPSWAALTPAGTPPSARECHSAIYDPVRDRMVVFGGFYSLGGYRDDVWALSLEGAPAWVALTPSGTPPSARCSHRALYDPVRDRMLVFGGVDDHGCLDDVWALGLAGTPAWTALAPTGTWPSAREGHSAIYDPVRDRTVMFGGDDWSSILDDVWSLSLAGTPAWTALAPVVSEPNGRWWHSAIYDPLRDRMVVFAGRDTLSYRNDVWSLSLSDPPRWTALAPAGVPPSPRCGHVAIYDAVHDCMVVFGGEDSSGCRNDSWTLSLGEAMAWTPLTPDGTPPGPRWSAGAICDPVRDRLIVYGGNSGSSLYGDVWALSLAGTPAWTMLLPTGTSPGARANHSAIYDPVRDRLVAFGGLDGLWQTYTDAWALSLAGTPAWAALTPTGSPPYVRWWYGAIYDPVRDRAVGFGGYNGSFGFYSDSWALSLAEPPAWGPPTADLEAVMAGTGPTARMAHSAIYDPVRDRMIVFGGGNPSGPMSMDAHYLRDVWALTWGTPAGVGGHEAIPPVGSLFAPAPNPSRGTTTVSWSIAQPGRVRLDVYDVSGRLVRRLVDGERRAGAETVVWDGTGDSGSRPGTGVYFVRLAGPGIRATRRLILLR